MGSNSSKKIAIFITLGMIFALSLILINIYNFNTGNSEISTDYNVDYNLENKNLKISAVSGKIHIIGNTGWTAAKTAGICTGNGTYSEPYVIEDLEIDGGGSGSCIFIENSDVYFRIENCSVYNSGPSFPDAGIRLSNVNNSLIIANNCSLNYCGIYLDNGVNNTISGNVMNECGLSIYGSLEELSSHNIDATNLVNGKPLYYYTNKTGLKSDDFLNGGQVYLINCSDSIISNLIVSQSGRGISLFYCNNNTVSGNTAINNYFGIYVDNSNNIIVLENEASNNSYGIYLHYSDNNTLSGNNASYNNDHGIYLSGGDNNTLLGNNASYNNDYGIYLYNSSRNTLTGNNASYNNKIGIYLSGGYYGSSDNNTLSGNNASYNNDRGIYLYSSDGNTLSDNNASYNNDHGIYLSNCNDNTISGNTAINNYFGIYVDNSNNIIVLGNEASNNSYGIYLSNSDFNSLSGNTVKDNALNGVHLSQCRNNIIEGNFIINNDVGIYLVNNLYYYTLFLVESTDNEISNNIYTGNNQELLEIINVINHPFRAVMVFLVLLLSIATVGIVIISFTAELITKQSYPKEDERYHLPIYGISALVFESAGALLFILGAIFLIPIDFSVLWLLILIPFAVVGIIISRGGRKNDAKKSLAGLGIGFGILLLILNSPLILIGLVVVVVIIVIAAVVAGIKYVFIKK